MIENNSNKETNVKEIKPMLSWACRFITEKIYSNTYIICSLIILSCCVYIGMKHSDYSHAEQDFKDKYQKSKKDFEEMVNQIEKDFQRSIDEIEKDFKEYKDRTDEAIAVQQVSINNLKINIKTLELRK